VTGDLVLLESPADPKDAALFAALLEGCSLKAAAKRAGVSESTARRRMRDDVFAGELRKAARQIAVAAYVGLLGLHDLARSAYRDVLTQNASPMAKLKAARDVFEGISKLGPLVDSADVDARLKEVERELARRRSA
jgi:hypothetical protein